MDGYINRYFLLVVFLTVLPSSLMAAPLWSDPISAQTEAKLESKQLNPHANSRRVAVDYGKLKVALSSAVSLAPGQAQKQVSTIQIELPMPYGELQTFKVYESSVMEPELAAKFPQIKTFNVVSTDDPSVTGRVDVGSKGFHAYLQTAEGLVYIDPVSVSNQQEYYTYYKRDYTGSGPKTFSCGVNSLRTTESPVTAFKTLARTSGNIITYTLAVAATGEYSQKVKKPSSITPAAIIDDAMAEIATAINRINQIYERDLAIRLILSADNNLIVYTDASTDPYTQPDNGSLLIDENQANIDSVITSSGYDIGHVLTTDDGGLASLAVACVNGEKARAESGLSTPVGDPFYIEILAHEIGHQLGANHSFNGTTLSCADPNRNAATAFEPGSGSTIMAYAGICGNENITTISDATFHAGSIAEIINYTRTGTGNICSDSKTTQEAPVADAGQDFVIPGGTAFSLIGSASDPESDVMTYQWDQMDVGAATSSIDIGTDNGSNALFRSFEPTISTERVFPQLVTLLNNTKDIGETLPRERRTLHFRFTARDGNGGVDEDDMQLVVDGDSGPFQLLQPNVNAILNSQQSQSIQWNAACTDQGLVNCSNVDISYTTDNGANFTSLVAGSTPNDGVELVNFPNISSNNVRIKVACNTGVFFDISDSSFQLNTTTGTVLPTAVIGGSYNCGTATAVLSGGGGGGGATGYWLIVLLMISPLRLARNNEN